MKAQQHREAFAQHESDADLLAELAEIASLCPTRALVVDEMVQRLGSHHRALIEIFAMRQSAVRILEGWALTLCMDAKERGILLRKPGETFKAEAPEQPRKAPARDYRP